MPEITWRTRLLAFVRLLRPLNVAMMALGVVIGALLAAGAHFFTVSGAALVLPAVLAAMAIGAGANAINDVVDLPIDRVNRSDRPLPSGLLSERVARWAWGVLSLAGILLAAAISWVHAVIAAASVGLLVLYSFSLKQRAVWGNLAVALVIGLALPFGALVPLQLGFGEVLPVLAGALFAFVTTLAREVVKDIQDMVGDRRGGARTLPLVRGPRAAGILAVALVLATVAGLPAARLLGLGPAFLALSLPAALLLLAAAWAALGTTAGEEQDVILAAGRASGLLKVGMLAGLAALALATW